MCHLSRAGVLQRLPRECAGGAHDTGISFGQAIDGTQGRIAGAAESPGPELRLRARAGGSKYADGVRHLSYPGELSRLPRGKARRSTGAARGGPRTRQRRGCSEGPAGLTWAGFFRDPWAGGRQPAAVVRGLSCAAPVSRLPSPQSRRGDARVSPGRLPHPASSVCLLPGNQLQRLPQQRAILC